MDESGLLGALAAIAILAVAGTVGVGVYLYSTDYTMKADVQDKQCSPTLTAIAIKTRLLGIDHTVEGVPQHECSIIQVGDEVRYKVRSQQTSIYRNGSCFYDSVEGPGCGKGALSLL